MRAMNALYDAPISFSVDAHPSISAQLLNGVRIVYSPIGPPTTVRLTQ